VVGGSPFDPSIHPSIDPSIHPSIDRSIDRSIHPSIHPSDNSSTVHRQIIDNSSTKQKMRTLTEETRAATDLERLWPAGVILEDGAAKAITRVEEFDWRATEAVPALEATRAAVKATILIDCCR